MIRAFALSSVAALALIGCASGVTLRNVRGSYQSVRQAVVSKLPGGIHHISENGREFDSGYFPPDVTKFQLDATKDKERAIAHLQILGDRRPYTVTVRVDVEIRQSNGRYERDGLDDKLTNELASRIRDDLVHRREDRNIIDDFRTF